MLLSIWLSCQTVSQTSPQIADSSEAKWPTYESPEQSADFQTHDLQLALSSAIYALPNWRAEDVFYSYDDVMSWSDGYCPYNTEIDGNALWYGGCESTQGVRYDGYLFRNVYVNYDAFGDGGTWDLDSLSGVADIQTVDGKHVHYGGTIYSGEGLSPEGFHTAISIIEGSFLDEQQSESWLFDGPSINLAQFRSTEPEGVHDGLYINGAIDIEGEIQTVYFNDISASTHSWDPSCLFNAVGVIGFRNQDGVWAYLFLESETGPTCDGCGSVFQDINRTQYIDELCLDVEMLLDNGLQSW